MARRKRSTAKEEAPSVTIHTQRLKSRSIIESDEQEYELDAEIFQTDPAYVRVAHGVTKSIGDYESLRIDVAVTVPCYREAIDRTAEDAGEQAALVLERELDEYGLDLHGDNG